MKTMRASLVAGFLVAVLGTACGGDDFAPVCEPQCEERNCGDDGCGGTCGTCDDGLSCTDDSCANGTCSASIQPFFCLIAKSCVPSGTMHPDNLCLQCLPNSAQEAWTGVDEGTECGLGKVCFEDDCCSAQANCQGLACGTNGCGGTCGECPEYAACEAGVCVEEVCEPQCDDKQCGDNQCGGSCGECGGQDGCVDGKCECVPACENKDCGNDGCGGTCGECVGINVVCEAGLCQCAGPQCAQVCCATYQVCTDQLQCCEPQCGAKQCGEDGCGGVCGVCQGGDFVTCVDGICVCKGTVCPKACCANWEICDTDGCCCDEQCEGKDCGDNGCGSVCGVCEPGAMCLDGLCPPPGKACEDGNDVDWDGCTANDIGEFRVNTTVADWQIDPAVAALNDGGYVVVWDSKEQDGDLVGVFAQRFGADGKAAGFEFQVNSEIEDAQEYPAVAGLADGRFVVVWESWGQDGSAEGIFGQLCAADGSKVAGEFQANEVTMADQSAPAVAALESGFVVAWQGTDPDADWNGIYAQLFDAAGGPSGSQFIANSTTIGEQSRPAVAGLSGGGFVAAWQSAGQDGDGAGIYFRLFEANGNPAGEESHANLYTADDQEFPVVASSGEGFALAWQSEGQDNSGWGVVRALYDGSGATVAAPALGSVFAAGDQRAPAIAARADDGPVLVWQSKDQDGSDYGVFVRLFDAGFDPAEQEFLANTFTLSIQSAPAVAALSGDKTVVVWQGWEQGGEGYDVFAARFDSAGNMLYH